MLLHKPNNPTHHASPSTENTDCSNVTSSVCPAFSAPLMWEDPSNHEIQTLSLTTCTSCGHSPPFASDHTSSSRPFLAFHHPNHSAIDDSLRIPTLHSNLFPTFEFSGCTFLVLISGSVTTTRFHHSI